MDGTSRTVLHNTNLSKPYDITIDYETQTLYWADYELEQIESSSTDGSNRTLLFSMGINRPFSITFYNGKLYWADWSIDGIVFVDVETPGESVTTRISGLSYDPYDIHIVTSEPERQPEGMYCYSVVCVECEAN